VHDGLEYITLASIHHILAYMAVHYPEVTLPICVCVPPVNRTEEYQTTQQEAFGQFIVETVIPFVNVNFATIPNDPDRWGSMGASNGGNISLYLAGTYPEQFHNLVLMSPYIPTEQYSLIAAQPPGTYDIYLNWGTYDIPLLVPLIEEFNAMLVDLEVNHYKKQFNEGHSWGLWRATIDEGLQFLFGEGVGGEDEHHQPEPNSLNLELFPYPNPFHDTVTVSINGARGPVSLMVYDIAGRAHVTTRLGAATRIWRWHPRGLPAARYVVRVTDESETRATVPLSYVR
jgi:enterochelin esterase family protein